ncbi:MAG: alpha/beta fold hydrolase [Acidimicrobiia bacterium]
MTDINRYLQIRSAGGGVFTADGSHVAYLTNVTGIPQAWAIPVDGGWPEQLTFGDDRVARVVASPIDPSLVVFERDDGGNERMQLHAVAIDGTGERDLIRNDKAIHRFGDFSPDGAWFTFCSNERNGVDFDLYRAPIDGGPHELVTELDGWVVPGRVSPDGRFSLATLTRSNVDTDALLVDLETGHTAVLTNWEEEARNQAVAFSQDGAQVFLLSDNDGDYVQAYRLDRSTGIATRFGPAGWDIVALGVSDGKGTLIVNEDGSSRLLAFDPRSLQDEEEVPLPLGVAADLEFSPQGDRLSVTISGAEHNPDVWILDVATSAISRLTRSSTAGLARASFVPPELVRISSFDDLSMPIWLYRPSQAAQPPVVVSVHGGPEAQELPAFNPIYQYLLAKGFAIAAPNVRGSAGYGRAYLGLDDLEKRRDAVADLGEVADYLRSRSDLDGGRMAVIGGSYGGYMVLSTLTTHPEQWAAGVMIVGISNLVTFLENTGDYRRAVREAEYGSLEHHRDLLEDLSPIHQVDKIRAPLLVIHGANDPRVPLSEAEQIVARLTEDGRPVELLVFPDEGHGLVKLANRKVAYRAVAEFLEEHLSATATP